MLRTALIVDLMLAVKLCKEGRTCSARLSGPPILRPWCALLGEEESVIPLLCYRLTFQRLDVAVRSGVASHQRPACPDWCALTFRQFVIARRIIACAAM